MEWGHKPNISTLWLVNLEFGEEFYYEHKYKWIVFKQTHIIEDLDARIFLPMPFFDGSNTPGWQVDLLLSFKKKKLTYPCFILWIFINFTLQQLLNNKYSSK